MDIYHERDAPVFIYSWKFQIIPIQSILAGWVAIGITNSTNHKDGDSTLVYDKSHHLYYSYLSIGVKSSLDQRDIFHGKGFDVNDVIEMIIDQKRKDIRFKVNDIDQGIAFDNIEFANVKYKMAVYNRDRNMKSNAYEIAMPYRISQRQSKSGSCSSH